MSAITLATHGIISEPKKVISVPKDLKVRVDFKQIDVKVNAYPEIIINVEVETCQ